MQTKPHWKIFEKDFGRMKMEEFKTGLYKHFKGGTVFVYALEKASEDGACPRVAYIGMQDGKCYSRPLDNFQELVKNADGQDVPRFSLVKEAKVDMGKLVPSHIKN